VLIFIWLGGDLYKLSYYVANQSPFALRACASFQIFMDLCILAQFGLYRKNTEAKISQAADNEKTLSTAINTNDEEDEIEEE
jgi:hypothetical protein